MALLECKDGCAFHWLDTDPQGATQDPGATVSRGLVVVVLLHSRLLEPLLSRDRLSAIQPCLLLSLAYGS